MKAISLRRPRLSFGLGPQVVAIVLVLGLAGAMAIQPTRQLFEQRSRIDEMSAELRQTELTNDSIAANIKRLRNPDYLEQEARAELGLVRPGETTYVVMPPSKRADKDKERRAESGKARPSKPGFAQRLLSFIGLL